MFHFFCQKLVQANYFINFENILCAQKGYLEDSNDTMWCFLITLFHFNMLYWWQEVCNSGCCCSMEKLLGFHPYWWANVEWVNFCWWEVIYKVGGWRSWGVVTQEEVVVGSTTHNLERGVINVVIHFLKDYLDEEEKRRSSLNYFE